MEKVHSLTVLSVRRIRGKAVLTLSNGEMINMPRAMLREKPYRSSAAFDHEVFDAFIRKRSYAFAMDKAVRLLASRARTERELVQALRDNAYPEETIARVMAYLTQAGYINDAEFAGNWVSARTTKGLGTRRIRMELQRKGVSHDEIEQALSEVDQEELFREAVKTAQKAAHGKNLSLPSDRQKILAAIARRGYDFSLAKQALQNLIDGQ